jgi:hypothetical protein
MDRTERIASFGFAGLSAFFSLYVLFYIGFRGSQTVTLTKTAIKGSCPPLKGYETVKHVGNLCHYSHVTPIATLWFEFAIVVLAAAAMAFFAWRRKRTGVVFVALIQGVAMGPFSTGLPFVALGLWLMWRAYRLQKYGQASFAGAGRGARDQAQAKKQPRTENLPVAKAEPGPRKVAEPSKRYTPKRTAKKR